MSDFTLTRWVRQHGGTLGMIVSVGEVVVSIMGWIQDVGMETLQTPGLTDMFWAGMISLGAGSIIAISWHWWQPHRPSVQFQYMESNLRSLMDFPLTYRQVYKLQEKFHQLGIVCPPIDEAPHSSQEVVEPTTERQWNGLIMRLQPLAELGNVRRARLKASEYLLTLQ